MPQLAYHFKVIGNAFIETLRLEVFPQFLEVLHLRPEVDIYLAYRLIYPILSCNEQIGGIDV